MATDVEAIVKRSIEVVRKAHNALRALRTSRSTPQVLSGAGSALDKLLNTLNSLATFPEVLASGRAFDIFSVTMPSGISLSDALLLDMEAIAGRLRFMTPPDSLMIVGDLDDHDCRYIGEMAECYNGSVASVLIQHDMCVWRLERCLHNH
jgi:hypothetical protein